MNNNSNHTVRRLWFSVATIILLIICLIVTSVALVLSMVSAEHNLFATGMVKINLNDGKPVITEGEFLFEPGMTVQKEFFVENNSSCDVYYKVYAQNAQGQLADVLETTIKDGETVLYTGTLNDCMQDNIVAPDDYLEVGEKRTLTITFHYPEQAGNATQQQFASFDFAADAVQVKNNPAKEFHE